MCTQLPMYAHMSQGTTVYVDCDTMWGYSIAALEKLGLVLYIPLRVKIKVQDSLTEPEKQGVFKIRSSIATTVLCECDYMHLP